MGLFGSFYNAISSAVSFYVTGKRSWAETKGFLKKNKLLDEPVKTFRTFVEYRSYNRLAPAFKKLDPETLIPESMITPTQHRLVGKYQYIFDAKVGYLGRRGTEHLKYSLLSNQPLTKEQANEMMYRKLEDSILTEESDKFSSIELNLEGVRKTRWIK